MTEQEKADIGQKNWHPLMRLVVENPISAFNAAAIIIGGVSVYYSNENRMTQMDARVLRLEQQQREDLIAANVKDDRTTQKVETITRDISDVKVTVRGIEAAVQFLVRQVPTPTPTRPP